MAIQTATVFTRPTDVALALETVAGYLREADVGSPQPNDCALNIKTDTAGTVTFSIAARGGNPAYSAVLTAGVA